MSFFVFFNTSFVNLILLFTGTYFLVIVVTHVITIIVVIFFAHAITVVEAHVVTVIVVIAMSGCSFICRPSKKMNIVGCPNTL